MPASLCGEISSTHIGLGLRREVFGIPKGANKIRMYHPTIYVMDEAAFLPEAQE